MRLDFDKFREIEQTLVRNRSRSLLTGFGIFWGVFMLLAMIGGGQGLKDLLSANFEGFATNSGFLIADKTTKEYKGFQKGRSWSLSLSDVQILRRRVKGLDVVTPNISLWGRGVTYSDKTGNYTAKGVQPEYARVEEPRLMFGRYINQVDVDSQRKVCVIGKHVYNTLFVSGENPCGKYLCMDGVYYQIVGVDANTGSISINGSTDRSVVIPLSVMQKVYNRGNSVEMICLTAKPGYTIKSLIEQSRQVVYREHIIHPEDNRAMFTLNTEQMFSIIDNLFRGVNILIWLVGLGTLIAGAIGVSNIMMVTVRERTVEIGIRRAIGATPKMILSQILLESIVLTLVSGMIGILFSVGVLSAAELAATKDGVLKAHFQISFLSAVGAAALLAFLGAAAGIAPALRAMGIKPVDAMRDE